MGLALQAHLGLHSEVPLLRDVARVPKEVVEEAEVEEASPIEVDVESTGVPPVLYRLSASHRLCARLTDSRKRQSCLVGWAPKRISLIAYLANNLPNSRT